MVTRFDLVQRVVEQDLSYSEAKNFVESKNKVFIRKQTFFALKADFKGQEVSEKRFSTKLGRDIREEQIIKRREVEPEREPTEIISGTKPGELYKSIKLSYEVEIFQDSNPSSNNTIFKVWGKGLGFFHPQTFKEMLVRFNNFKMLMEIEFENLEYIKSFRLLEAHAYTQKGTKIKIA